MDKHSSLLWTFVNYGRKKFYNFGPRSFTSIILGFLHCTSLSKGFVSLKGKLILAVFAILSLLGRLSAIVLYFAPGANVIKLFVPLLGLPSSKDKCLQVRLLALRAHIRLGWICLSGTFYSHNLLMFVLR